MAKAVFLDRDGTLMEETHYCADPAKVRVLAGVPDALRRFKEAGFLAIVITNQSGIGRGLITQGQYEAVQAELLRQIGPGLIDAVYFCPDPPGISSTRRKPEPGMVFEAAADFQVKLSDSYFIGDKATDIECGRRAGTRTVLVLTGYGAEETGCAPDFTAPDLPAAAALIAGPRS